MPSNIIKLVLISMTISALLGFLGLQASPAINLEGYSGNEQFALAIGASALIASLVTGIVLLIKPYDLPIQKQTLFIGNLAFKASERELRRLFNRYGEVFSVRLMTDKATRKPRGYGFIEMEKKAANVAIAQLNEKEFMGRDLRVGHANEPSHHTHG
ncbi:MAG TPA: RNA-binding protein [Gammaproteobacteria bacterium]|nr:RNA-binding protein [Gammaproteobacteria bacterium]